MNAENKKYSKFVTILFVFSFIIIEKLIFLLFLLCCDVIQM